MINYMCFLGAAVPNPQVRFVLTLWLLLTFLTIYCLVKSQENTWCDKSGFTYHILRIKEMLNNPIPHQDSLNVGHAVLGPELIKPSDSDSSDSEK